MPPVCDILWQFWQTKPDRDNSNMTTIFLAWDTLTRSIKREIKFWRRMLGHFVLSFICLQTNQLPITLYCFMYLRIINTEMYTDSISNIQYPGRGWRECVELEGKTLQDMFLTNNAGRDVKIKGNILWILDKDGDYKGKGIRKRNI